ncbi:MarR family transcriptional regulator [Psychromonas sp. MME2]|uniref:MarR family winged helix-turn-helix transcriptional regulator n=1 Tax=unclassified Psychromonas TaxID=2614957 RepID=UPI00339C116C
MKTITEKLNHAFIEFYEKLSAWEANTVKDNGLTLTLVHAVEILGIFGAMPMKTLASKVGVTTGTLTVQVDKLVAADLVRRVAHESDRRSILVELSDQGHNLFLQHDQLHQKLTEELTADFTEEEIAQLMNLLTRINNKF